MLNFGEKLQQAAGKQFAAIAGAIFLAALLLCLIYPAVKNVDASVVYLRTTFPASLVQVHDTVSSDGTLAMELPVMEADTAFDGTEQRLVSMLMKDDTHIDYDKPENKERWQVVRMRVTGYCSCPICCGKYADGKTANCHSIRKGDRFVAADKKYHFGTEMIIPGYNHEYPVKVLDRGRLIKGNRLDVYFDTHSQAQKWGVKELDVLIKMN